MKIYFATVAGSPLFSRILNEAGANNRLLSYFELRDRPGFLEHYLMTGRNPDGKPMQRRGPPWAAPTYAKARTMALLRRIRFYENNPPDDEDVE